MRIKISKRRTGKKEKNPSYPCMRMKMSKRGTNKQKNPKNILSLYENENLKRGQTKEKKGKKHLCPNKMNIKMKITSSNWRT
jgi:hypothetical protein